MISVRIVSNKLLLKPFARVENVNDTMNQLSSSVSGLSVSFEKRETGGMSYWLAPSSSVFSTMVIIVRPI